MLRSTNKKNKDQRTALLEFIKSNKLTGSPNNRAAVVFDGYPDGSLSQGDFKGINVIFSRRDSADDRIRGILERSGGSAGVVVVSNDKEVRFFARSMGAAVLTVEDFVEKGQKSRPPGQQPLKPELTHIQMHRINTELRKLWLGE